MPVRRLALLACLVGLVVSIFLAPDESAAAGQIHCVDDGGGATGTPCVNATAYTTIQEAVDIAAPGDEIRVAGGTYTNTGVSVVSINKALTIIGGYAGGDSGWTISDRLTVVDGEGLRAGVEIQGNPTVTIQQLTVSRGGITNPSGILHVQSGVLKLAANGGASNGHFDLASGAVLEFPADWNYSHSAHSLGDATITGSGAMRVSSGAVSISTSTTGVSVENLELLSGVLTGPGQLTVDRLTWSAGTMSGSGTITIPSTGTLTFTTASTKSISGRHVQNAGAMVVSTGSGNIFIGEGAQITNSGTFDIQGGQSIVPGNGSLPLLVNTSTGRLIKSAGAAAGVSIPIINDGAIELSPNTRLQISHDVTSRGTGTAIIGEGAILRIAGGTHAWEAGTTITGAGNMEFFSSTVTITGSYTLTGTTEIHNGGSVAFDSATLTALQRMVLGSGVLTGSGQVTINWLNWTSGTMKGTGTTIIPSGGSLSFTTASTKFLDSRSLRNEGLMTVSGDSGYIYIGAGARVTNSGTIDLQGDRSILVGNSPAPLLANTSNGRVIKSAGTGVGALTLPIMNEGVIEVRSGTLAFSQNLTSSGAGTAVIADGAMLRVDGGTHSWEAGTTITGAGAARFMAGVTTIAGAYTVSGLTEIYNSGSVAFNSTTPTVVPRLTFASGILTGTGQVTINDLNWSAGTMSGAGTTIIPSNGHATVMSYGGKMISDRTLHNEGTITLKASITFNGAAQLINDGRIDMQGDLFLDPNLNSATRMTNTSTGWLVKSAGTGQGYLRLPLTNSGTIEVRMGALNLGSALSNLSGTTLTGGAYLIAGTLQFDAVDIVTNAATIVLDGPGAKIRDPYLRDGLRSFATNTADGSLTITNGRNLSTPRDLNTAGRVAIGPNSTLTINGAYNQSAGATTLQTGALTANGGVDIQAGTLVGSGTITGDVANAGLVSPGVSSGSLSIIGNYRQSATGRLRIELGGTTADTQFDQLAVSGNASLDGELSLNLIDGFDPAVTDSFTIVPYGSLSGGFATVTAPVLDDGRALAVTYPSGGVTVVVETTPVNQAPSVDAGGPYSVDEGGSVILAAAGQDAEGDPLTYVWNLDNDGSFETTGQQVTFSAVSLDGPSTWTVTVRVTDSAGQSGTAEATIAVNNVAPSIAPVEPPDPVAIVTSVVVTTSFTDPGASDTHTASWDWGDGSASSGSVAEANGVGTVTGDHAYQAAGVYTVILTVTDKDGAVSTSGVYVVVYDPEAGFVTGNGTIDSPAGAYAPDPTLTGKAAFGFVSKYRKGATIPSGHTHFRFHAANLRFKSTSYEWLVVSGARAQYKGSGTINDVGDYGFMLTANDGEVDGGGGVDRFRIKIWDKATGSIVYDNQMGDDETAPASTAIESGKIVIHSK